MGKSCSNDFNPSVIYDKSLGVYPMTLFIGDHNPNIIKERENFRKDIKRIKEHYRRNLKEKEDYNKKANEINRENYRNKLQKQTRRFSDRVKDIDKKTIAVLEKKGRDHTEKIEKLKKDFFLHQTENRKQYKDNLKRVKESLEETLDKNKSRSQSIIDENNERYRRSFGRFQRAQENERRRFQNFTKKKAQMPLDQLRDRIKTLNRNHQNNTDELIDEHGIDRQSQKKYYNRKIDSLGLDHKDDMYKLNERIERNQSKMSDDKASIGEIFKKKYESRLKELKRRHDHNIEKMKYTHEKDFYELNKKHKKETAMTKKSLQHEDGVNNHEYETSLKIKQLNDSKDKLKRKMKDALESREQEQAGLHRKRNLDYKKMIESQKDIRNNIIMKKDQEQSKRIMDLVEKQRSKEKFQNEIWRRSLENIKNLRDEEQYAYQKKRWQDTLKHKRKLGAAVDRINNKNRYELNDIQKEFKNKKKEIMNESNKKLYKVTKNTRRNYQSMLDQTIDRYEKRLELKTRELEDKIRFYESKVKRLKKNYLSEKQSDHIIQKEMVDMQKEKARDTLVQLNSRYRYNLENMKKKADKKIKEINVNHADNISLLRQKMRTDRKKMILKHQREMQKNLSRAKKEFGIHLQQSDLQKKALVQIYEDKLSTLRKHNQYLSKMLAVKRDETAV